MVAPDDSILYARYMGPRAFRQLSKGAIVVEAREGGDVLGRNGWSMLFQYQRIRIGWIGHTRTRTSLDASRSRAEACDL